MEMICYYVAEDGAKFTDEDECEEYELKSKIEKHFNHGMKWLNGDMDETRDIGEVNYAILPTLEAKELFTLINAYQGFSYKFTFPIDMCEFPVEIYYDHNLDCWGDLKQISHEYNKALDLLKATNGENN